MAAEFAKRFYRSAVWRRTREYIFTRAKGICEECGARPGEEVHHIVFLTAENINDPEIALGEKNLKLVCRECHEAIHCRAAVMNRARKIKHFNPKYGFDEDGNMVKRKNVFVVWGAPASGKTRYVRDNAGQFDIVVDLDSIKNALAPSGDAKNIPDILPFALDAREGIYQAIEKREHYCDRIFVVACLPNKRERAALVKRLDAEEIHIDTDEETCKMQAQYDDARKDKAQACKIIERYFKELEL